MARPSHGLKESSIDTAFNTSSVPAGSGANRLAGRDAKNASSIAHQKYLFVLHSLARILPVAQSLTLLITGIPFLSFSKAV